MSTASTAVCVEQHPSSRIRTVRTAVLSFVVAVVIAIASLQAFTVLYGVEHRLFDARQQGPSAGAAVDQIVAEQRSVGLTCRTEPALTDQVVFQYDVDSRVAPSAGVLTFEEAVVAQKSGAGSIQRYCF